MGPGQVSLLLPFKVVYGVGVGAWFAVIIVFPYIQNKDVITCVECTQNFHLSKLVFRAVFLLLKTEKVSFSHSGRIEEKKRKWVERQTLVQNRL